MDVICRFLNILSNWRGFSYCFSQAVLFCWSVKTTCCAPKDKYVRSPSRTQTGKFFIKTEKQRQTSRSCQEPAIKAKEKICNNSYYRPLQSDPEWYALIAEHCQTKTMTYPCVDTGGTYIFMSHGDDLRTEAQVGCKKGQMSIFRGAAECTVWKHQ